MTKKFEPLEKLEGTLRIDEIVEDNPDLWEEEPIRTIELEDGIIALYWSLNNDGTSSLSLQQMLELRDRGYQAQFDLFLHPEHWTPVVEAIDEGSDEPGFEMILIRDREGNTYDRRDILGGLDGQVVPKSPEAIAWAKHKNHI